MAENKTQQIVKCSVNEHQGTERLGSLKQASYSQYTSVRSQWGDN